MKQVSKTRSEWCWQNLPIEDKDNPARQYVYLAHGAHPGGVWLSDHGWVDLATSLKSAQTRSCFQVASF